MIGNCRGIGRRDAEHLAAAGVRTLDDLVSLGPVAASRRLLDAGAPGVVEPLWMLEAAASGVAPEDVSPTRLAELHDQLRAAVRGGCGR